MFNQQNISKNLHELLRKKYNQTKKSFMVTIHIAYILTVLMFLNLGLLLNMNRGEEQIPDPIGLGSRFGFNAPILGLILRLWGCSTVYN